MVDEVQMIGYKNKAYFRAFEPKFGMYEVYGEILSHLLTLAWVSMQRRVVMMVSVKSGMNFKCECLRGN